MRGAVFTNLTQDHLDYHRSMEAYFDAKARMLDYLVREDAFVVYNAEDPWCRRFAELGGVPHHSYGAGGDVCAENVDIRADGTDFRVVSPWGAAGMRMSLCGDHNVSNALGAITVCAALGASIEEIAEALAVMPAVPGRFESVDKGQDFRVVVDYAHTDDGLRNVLRAARRVCTARVIGESLY